MASAPLGWVQDTSDAANNRMLRVVNGVGTGVGGSFDPTYNNVVPTHQHPFTTGNESANHLHADAGHQHDYFYKIPESGNDGSGYAVAGILTPGQRTYRAGVWEKTNYAYAAIGYISANHKHSGATDPNYSPAVWYPRYNNVIICQKS